MFTYVVLLLAGDRVAADLSVLNGRQVPAEERLDKQQMLIHSLHVA